MFLLESVKIYNYVYLVKLFCIYGLFRNICARYLNVQTIVKLEIVCDNNCQCIVNVVTQKKYSDNIFL